MDDKSERITAVVVAILEDMTQDWELDESTEIGPNSTVMGDLDFASVDLIQLVVAIEEHYGAKLGFQDLLMVDGLYVEDLSVMEISNFVLSRVTGEVYS